MKYVVTKNTTFRAEVSKHWKTMEEAQNSLKRIYRGWMHNYNIEGDMFYLEPNMTANRIEILDDANREKSYGYYSIEEVKD